MFHQIVDTVFTWLQTLGEWGVFFGLMLEVIPSEIILAYGGYLVSLGHASFITVVLFGIVGGVLAQIVVYAIARYGGRPFLDRFGKYLLINKHHIDKSEEWFNKYGAGVIFTARFVPIVRHAISIPAGLTRMSLWRFTLLTTLAVIPWTIGFVFLGYKLGGQWQNINEAAAPYVQPFILIALAGLVLYFVMKFTINKKKAGNT